MLAEKESLSISGSTQSADAHVGTKSMMNVRQVQALINYCVQQEKFQDELDVYRNDAEGKRRLIEEKAKIPELRTLSLVSTKS